MRGTRTAPTLLRVALFSAGLADEDVAVVSRGERPETMIWKKSCHEAKSRHPNDRRQSRSSGLEIVAEEYRLRRVLLIRRLLTW